MRGKSADVSVMPAIQLGECLAIAFGDSSDQQIVRQRGFAHISYSAERLEKFPARRYRAAFILRR